MHAVLQHHNVITYYTGHKHTIKWRSDTDRREGSHSEWWTEG